jgi:phosphoenolpyruvate synthase/pyruvate phosphate dikinase
MECGIDSISLTPDSVLRTIRALGAGQPAPGG